MSYLDEAKEYFERHLLHLDFSEARKAASSVAISSTLERGETLEVDIHGSVSSNNAYGISSLANEHSLLIPNVLVGERIKAQIVYTNKKRQMSYARVVDFVKRSSARVDPFCQYFGDCGGCQMQHVKYEAQLRWKQEFIVNLFLDLVDSEFVFSQILESPKQIGYRTKLTPSFSVENGSIARVGFNASAEGPFIVDIESCALAPDVMNDAFKNLRRELIGKPSNPGSLILRMCSDDSVNTDPKGISFVQVNEYSFKFATSDFFQVNASILPPFIAALSNILRLSDCQILVDAYCGVGILSIMNHRFFQRIIGIEVSSKAVQFAKENATLNSVANVEFLTGSSESIFASIKELPEKVTILIDPPRRGCSESFLTQLRDFGPKSIVYISCHPPSQALDISYLLYHLKAPYFIETVQAMDFFPQTGHIENMIHLRQQ